MRILVDAREIAGRPTGVGRYLLQLLRRWSARADASQREIVLAAPALPSAARGLGFRTVETGGGAGTWWEQARLPALVRAESPDVLFSPAYTCPLWTSVPIVLTIHDISFSVHPEWFSSREGLRRRLLTRASARKASTIVTVSRFSAQDIQAYYGVAPSRIRVIHHGIAHLPRAPGIEREPLALFVGSIFNRRHVPELLAAVARLLPGMPELRLAIVGENRTRPRQDLVRAADTLGVRAAVDFADYAEDDRLAALYARARAFVFVSDYEGFGLTPLEAMAAGVPPVVADTAVAHETCGDAAVYVPPGDVERLAQAIRLLIEDEVGRARVVQAAPAVLARYDWGRAADETLALLEQVGAR